MMVLLKNWLCASATCLPCSTVKAIGDFEEKRNIKVCIPRMFADKSLHGCQVDLKCI